MTKIFVFILLFVTLSFSISAQTLPKSERERIENYGAMFVRAINSEAADLHTKTVEEVFSKTTIQNDGVTRIITLFPKIRASLGELEYHHSDLSEFKIGDRVSYVLHVYAKAKGAKNWQDIQLRIEPNQPHKIEKVVFIAEVSEPISLPNTAINDSNTLNWLNNYVDKLIADNDLAGSVLIAQGDQPFYQREFGFADAKRTVKVNSDTRFNLASGNKMFTAIAIAQLAEKGKLNYTDSIAKYFPDFPNPEAAKKITIHHLLSHTSGVKEYWTEDFSKNAKEIREVKQMLPWVYKVGTDFEPGSKVHYSNSNFVLAGLIVEKASGMDYYEYVRKNITEPLGMTVTDFYFRDGSVANLAEPLGKGANGWETTEYKGGRGTSAGGGYSTTQELLKFARGLVGGKLVSKSTLATMTTSKTRIADSQLDYGYGFELQNQGNVISFGHGGIAKGVNFELRYYPAEDITLIMFNNQDNGAYDDLKKNITKLITGAR